MHHLVWNPGGKSSKNQEYVPHLYFEARIDFADVRSGFRESLSVSRAMELQPLEDDLLWTPDMVRNVDETELGSGKPSEGRLRSLPDFVDAALVTRMEGCFISFLLRYHSVSIYRNPVLNVYSRPSESLDSFRARCAELAADRFRKELDSLHDVFVRKLTQLKEKYLPETFGEADSSEFNIAKANSHLRSRFRETYEIVSGLLLQGGGSSRRIGPEESLRGREHELDERLHAIEAEARQEIARVERDYRECSLVVDPYPIRPNLKDIRMVRSGIVWMPSGGKR